MENPRDPRWKEGKLVQADIFDQNNVREYLDAILGINGDDSQPDILDHRTHRRQWKKLILVLKKESIEGHLQRTEKLNTFLGILTKQNQPTATTRRAPRRNTRHYKRIRSHAIDLYNILEARFPSSPTCKCALEPHHMSIKLGFRSAQLTEKAVYFHAIFTSETSTFNTSSNWREIETEPWKKIQEDVLCQDTDHVKTSPPDGTEIIDLCAAITGPASKGWLGHISNRQGQQHRIRILDARQRLPASDKIQTVSLAEVLSDPQFYEEQRLRLALKLASSVMQLHTTEWLTDFWSKSDVSFMRSKHGVIDFDNPLIGRTFGARGYDLNCVSETLPRPTLHASIPCLFSLGIVLLELKYRRLFEDLKSEVERSMPPEFSDSMAARRLTDEMIGSTNYQDAVVRCILGLDAAYRSLAEERFQKEVEEKIISLIAEDLKIYCAKTSVEACLEMGKGGMGAMGGVVARA
ncbi:Synaptobrevin [Penicillium cosmopolitanum]|uniref:Synaptobrevin n=1 Tax=Penicillium cosmopolitanum TaxID=1131564 RepID=A0A9W9W3L3_9EURO|nr:Synaptobrevin [Penicillium cosmopolitanum]KAJ5397932.1 Synaptobrevin [Penicillium cosmopolitanum]